MRSEEDIKNCTTNGVPNETIIGSLMSELETLRKAYELACKAIQENTEPDYCNSYSDAPCRKGNIFGKAWDDNKCVECCKEHFITQARKRGVK